MLQNNNSQNYLQNQSLGIKEINNSFLGVYRIYKILEQLKLINFNDIKQKNPKQIQNLVYQLYQKLKKDYNSNNDIQLHKNLSNDIKLDNNIKQIIQSYFESAFGSNRDIRKGDLLDSLFIQSICKNCEIQSHLNYKFGGIYLYQDFDKLSPKYLDPKGIVKNLINNLHGIHINQEEYDKRLKQLGLDDGIDNIKYLKSKVSKISELGFVLNTCHHYSPGQHWVSMCFQLANVVNPKGLFLKLFYYDSQMTTKQQSYIGFQTEPLDCEYNQNCPEYLRQNYLPKVEEWLKDFMQVCEDNNIIFKINKQTNLIDVHFNKINTQQDEYSCGYHSILFQYLMATNGEALNSIQKQISNRNFNSLDHIIDQFRQMLIQNNNNQIQNEVQNQSQNENIGGNKSDNDIIEIYV